MAVVPERARLRDVKAIGPAAACGRDATLRDARHAVSPQVTVLMQPMPMDRYHGVGQCVGDGDSDRIAERGAQQRAWERLCHHTRLDTDRVGLRVCTALCRRVVRDPLRAGREDTDVRPRESVRIPHDRTHHPSIRHQRTLRYGGQHGQEQHTQQRRPTRHPKTTKHRCMRISHRRTRERALHRLRGVEWIGSVGICFQIRARLRSDTRASLSGPHACRRRGRPFITHRLYRAFVTPDHGTGWKGTVCEVRGSGERCVVPGLQSSSRLRLLL
jgi:hypothetical protein